MGFPAMKGECLVVPVHTECWTSLSGLQGVLALTC